MDIETKRASDLGYGKRQVRSAHSLIAHRCSAGPGAGNIVLVGEEPVRQCLRGRAIGRYPRITPTVCGHRGTDANDL